MIGDLPAPTLRQRCASLSTLTLEFTGRALHSKTDAASQAAYNAVLEELERRLTADGFASYLDSLGAQVSQ